MKEVKHKSLPEDTFEAIQYYVNRILKFDAKLNTVERRRYYNNYVDFLLDLENFAWKKKIRIRTPEMSGIPLEDISMIVIFCSNLLDELERTKHLSKSGLQHKQGGKGSTYRPLAWEQEDNDHHILQRLINQQRELIQTSLTIPETQQYRLLRRLESFQSALHKRKSRMRVVDSLFDSD